MKKFSIIIAKVLIAAIALLCVIFTAVILFQKSNIGQSWAYQQGRTDLIRESQAQQAAQQSNPVINEVTQ